MGRLIDLSKPLNEEDRAYLMSRSREGEVTVNERQFAAATPEELYQLDEDAKTDAADEAELQKAIEEVEAEDADGYPDHLVDKVEPLTVAQLRTALKKRGLDSDGNKDELRVRLVEYLEAQEKQKEAESKASTDERV